MSNNNKDNLGKDVEDRFATLDIDGINDIYYQQNEPSKKKPEKKPEKKPKKFPGSNPDFIKILVLVLTVIVVIMAIYTAIVGILGSGFERQTTGSSSVLTGVTVTSTTITAESIVNVSSQTTKLPEITTDRTTEITTQATTRDPIYNPEYENAVIFIDAGHGGSDPGSLDSSKKYYESHINLDVALLVQKELEKRGLTVIMSRTSDVSVELESRAAQAKKAGADMLVSIHCNSAVPAAYGTRIYYTARSVTYNKTKFAAYFEKSFEKMAKSFSDMRKDVFVRSDVEETGGKLAVLCNTNMPSVLIELGFITNENDLKLLLNDNWQQSAAKSIADAIENAYNAGFYVK